MSLVMKIPRGPAAQPFVVNYTTSRLITIIFCGWGSKMGKKNALCCTEERERAANALQVSSSG